MPDQTTTKKPATQEFIDIAEIRDGVVILKNGGLRSVLMCGSRNLELESTDSQNAIINVYADFINSFDWPMQIVVHSRKLNIKPYLSALEEKLKIQTNELLKIQTAEYIDFIKNFVTLSNIMTKRFYTIIPFDPIESKTGAPIEKFGSLFGKIAKNEKMTEEKFQEFKTQLSQRADHIILSLARIGIKSAPLQTEELIELLYNLYNPEEYEHSIFQ